jgi:hypothetical protein
MEFVHHVFSSAMSWNVLSLRDGFFGHQFVVYLSFSCRFYNVYSSCGNGLYKPDAWSVTYFLMLVSVICCWCMHSKFRWSCCTGVGPCQTSTLALALYYLNRVPLLNVYLFLKPGLYYHRLNQNLGVPLNWLPLNSLGCEPAGFLGATSSLWDLWETSTGIGEV